MTLQLFRKRSALSATIRVVLAVTMIAPGSPALLFAQDGAPSNIKPALKAALNLQVLQSVDVDPETGTLLCQFEDAGLGDRDLFFAFKRTWRELDGDARGVGFGWALSTDQRLEGLGKDELCFVDAEGQRRWFRSEGSSYKATRGYPATIKSQGDKEKTHLLTGLGDERSYLFNAVGQILSISDQQNRSLKFQYADGLLTSIKSKSGTLTFDRNNEGKISAARMGAKQVRYEYTKKGSLARVITPNNLVWTYGYDSKDRLNKIGNDSVLIGYDSIGRVIRVSGKNVRKRRYFYLTSADPARSYICLTENDGGEKALYAQSFDGRYIERISEAGARTFVELDERDRPIVLTDALGQKTEYGYDSKGRTSVIESPNGLVTEFQYKGENTRPSSIKKGEENWQFSYDDKNQLTAVIAPTGAKETLSYNALGQLIKTLDHRGLKRDYSYNAAGQLSEVIENDFQHMYLGYDAHGRITLLTRPDGKKATVQYNAYGQVAAVKESSGKTVEYEYNRFGQLSTHTDEMGYKVQYKYTRFGEVRLIKDSKGLVQQYEYDKAGHLSAAVDALGNRTRYHYADKRYIVTNPNGSQRRFDFDDSQRVRMETLPNGRKIAYDYNKQGLLTKMAVQGSPNAGAVFRYTKRGRLQAMANAESQFRIQYDNVGRILSLTDDKLKKSIAYKYNKAGDRTEMQLPFGKVTYKRDTYGRITEMTDVDGGAIKIAYLFDGRRSSIQYPNGVKTTFKYDKSDRLTSLSTTDKAGKVLSSRSYGYDALGRRESMTTEKGVKETYAYDARGRMTDIRRGATEPAVSFGYDAADNRTEKTINGQSQQYQFGKGNQLLSTGTEKLKYNASGQLIRRISKRGVTRYSYSAQGKLTKVEKPGATVSYGYAPNGTRVWREINGKRRYYLHDFSDVVGEYNAKGKLIRSYTHGPDEDDVLASHSQGKANATYYHYDAVRSVVAMTDKAGAVVGRYDYDAFGGLRKKEGAATQWNPYGFTSRRRDPATGLQYFRARYYDASLGRFTSQDPVGFIDGPNRYAYARNNPALYNDPYGLWSVGGLWNSATSKVSSAWESTKRVSSRAWKATKEVATYAGRQTVAFGKGFGKGVWNGAKGVYTMVRHPIQTVKGVVYAVENWEQTKEAIGGMWDTYMDAMHNDPEKFAEMTGMLTGELVFAIAGTKGLDKIAKVASLAKVGQGAAKLSRAAGVTRAVGSVGAKVGSRVGSVGRTIGTKAAKLGTAAARRFPRTAAAARVLASKSAKISAAMKKVAADTARKVRAIDRARKLSAARFAARGGNIVTRNARKLAAIPGNLKNVVVFAAKNPGPFLAYGTYNLTRGALRTIAAVGRGTWNMGRRAAIPTALIFKDDIADSINKYESRDKALAVVIDSANKLLKDAKKLSPEELQKRLDATGTVYSDFRNNLLKPIHDETNTFNNSLEEFNEIALNENLSDDAILSRMESALNSFVRRRDNLLKALYEGDPEEEHSYNNPSANRTSTFDDEIELLTKVSETLKDDATRKLIEDRIATLKEAKGTEYALYRSGDHDTMLSYLAGENVDLSGALGIPGLGGEVPGVDSSGMSDAIDQVFEGDE
jgi:RHS repeat-associated protein